jgi:hypothetical protein
MESLLLHWRDIDCDILLRRLGIDAVRRRPEGSVQYQDGLAGHGSHCLGVDTPCLRVDCIISGTQRLAKPVHTGDLLRRSHYPGPGRLVGGVESGTTAPATGYLQRSHVPSCCRRYVHAIRRSGNIPPAFHILVSAPAPRPPLPWLPSLQPLSFPGADSGCQHGRNPRWFTTAGRSLVHADVRWRHYHRYYWRVRVTPPFGHGADAYCRSGLGYRTVALRDNAREPNVLGVSFPRHDPRNRGDRHQLQHLQHLPHYRTTKATAGACGRNVALSSPAFFFFFLEIWKITV